MNLQLVPIEKIWFSKRYRVELGDIESLAESIKEKGLIQPITVTEKFELLAGGRRLEACKSVGLKEVPCILRPETDELDHREIELIENLQRLDMTWAERAALVDEIDRLMKEKKEDWSGRKTAALLGRSVTNVARDIKLASYITAVPELSGLKTADEAEKLVKKIEEKAIVEELHKRQLKAVGEEGLEKGLLLMLKLADKDYRIGDTFKGMAELKSNGPIHIIECDPPYGIDLTDVKRSKDSVTSNVHSYNEIEKEDYNPFLQKLAKELYRVASTNAWLIFWFGPTWQSEVLAALRDAGWLVDEIPAVWTKHQGQTMQPELYLGRAYEPFYLCRKGQPVLVKRGRLNVFDFATVPGSQKMHPTERPVALIQELFETLALPRQQAFIPFLGSGNSLRAAYNCGMAAFGYDLNGEYKPQFMLRVEEDTKAIGDDLEEELPE